MILASGPEGTDSGGVPGVAGVLEFLVAIFGAGSVPRCVAVVVDSAAIGSANRARPCDAAGSSLGVARLEGRYLSADGGRFMIVV